MRERKQRNNTTEGSDIFWGEEDDTQKEPHTLQLLPFPFKASSVLMFQRHRRVASIK